ncbi:LysE family translocator [Pseudaestuariivita atlantica]|uniref:Lysine transporter LysE n=1 Tax=Pseudaestuariivita atlantica TaxID=1317121 RepID=A0A0L1JPP0_9RHOB|nr:LysE family translocator [Pseudaestuariivita atlantica]KNG93682.1 lysine transporter LysE [Pseudaestuariivita atlantica]
MDPLYGFVFLGLFSPGPNVILLTMSGARFGFAATLPHLLGVALGVGVIAAVTGLGIAALLLAQPALELVLKIIAAAWILWMALGLWRSSARSADGKGRPMTFFEAVLFQWVNPKVWAVALTAASAYPGAGGPVSEAARLALAFSGVNLFVCLFWTSAGALLQRLLTRPMAWRLFARTMAVALAVFAFLIFV